MKRVGVRNGELQEGFTRRLREAFAKGLATQRSIARGVACREDTLSRLVRGEATGIRVDLVVALACWLDDRGMDLRWVLTGRAGAAQDSVPIGTLGRIVEAAVREALRPPQPSTPVEGEQHDQQQRADGEQDPELSGPLVSHGLHSTGKGAA